MTLYLEHTECAIAAALRHAQSSSKEICGVCFGRMWQTSDDRWHVVVEDCWPAPEMISEHANVSFTHRSWAAALDRLDQLREKSPEYGWRIVGWYHSHPGFGIFFSPIDRHSHRMYFPQPWHVALVIDPHSKIHGWFGHDHRSEQIILIRSRVAKQTATPEPQDQTIIGGSQDDREVNYE